MNEALATLAIRIYTFLMPISWVAFFIALVFLVPMAFFRGMRRQAGFNLIWASYVFGLTTWLLGAAVTFATLGWFGLLVGLFLLGVGVVPIGIFSAFFIVKSFSLELSLILMVAVVFAFRMGGAALAAYETEAHP